MKDKRRSVIIPMVVQIKGERRGCVGNMGGCLGARTKVGVKRQRYGRDCVFFTEAEASVSLRVNVRRMRKRKDCAVRMVEFQSASLRVGVRSKQEELRDCAWHMEDEGVKVVRCLLV
jgi:hypothetical protein